MRALDLAGDLAHVLDGVDDVAGAGFALGADHGGAFGDAAEGFAEVARAADEGRGEGVLVDVVDFVGGGEDFGLVDEVDAEGLEDLGFDEVADAGLGHDGDGDGGDDLLDELGVGHAGDAAFGADHGGNALQRHDGDGAGFFGDAGLLDVHDVHDDAALEHFGEAELEAQGGGAEVAVEVAVLGVVCHEGCPSGGAGCGVRESRARKLMPTLSLAALRGGPCDVPATLWIWMVRDGVFCTEMQDLHGLLTDCKQLGSMARNKPLARARTVPSG